jgi:hypothetical protein
MNFFQRRKILKDANFLHLVPVRVMEHTVAEDGKVTVLLPRFKNKFWREVYRNSKKGEFITIRLDETGSAIWLLIDSTSSVEKLSENALAQHPDRFTTLDDAQTRITKFLALLYQQRYISFQEIMN